MKHIKHLFFLSILGSLVFFNACSEDSDDPVVDDTTDTTDDGTTDPVNYTLTLTASQGGTVSPEPGAYSENESVELLATPDSTYAFVNWTGSSTSTDNPLSVTMDADKSYIANFAKKQYPLTIIIEGEGAVSEEIITNGRVEDYDEGTIVKLNATPLEGWEFNGWKELEVATNPLEVTITEALTLTAKFTKNYALTLTASEGGTVTPESGSYIENDTVELIATPDSTSVFVNWTGSLTSTDNPLSVIMDADKDFTANFAKRQYPLTIIVEGEGAVSEEIVTNGRVEDYDEGTVVKLTANPSQGWKFNGWKELEVATNPLAVTITEAITLTAKFYVPIDSVSLTPSALQMILGAIDTLKASIYPTNVSDTIHWKSSDESIASVTQEGIVTAIAKGEAVITVMTAKDSITNTAQITVILDADRDGVIDENDTCADTPEGAAVNANGCADSQKDTDSDGVKDDKDTCSDTPEGATVDANGCADSQKDTDGDGVTDDLDTCAGTASGATVDANGCAYAFRTDTYSSFLKLAIPGSTFTGLITDGFDDVHADIVGSGTNIQYALTGSATEVNLDTDVKWGADGYGTSVFTQDAGQWGTTTEAQLNWQSSNFVIEGYVYMDETFARPPFWKVPVRHDKYFVSADFGNPNPVVAGSMRMRLTLDTSVQGQTQYVSSNVSYNLNQWYHIAWVRTGNQLRYYFDGNNVYATSFSGGSVDTDGTLYRIMRGESITNDGAAGSWQDFRVYIGTDKGYTTETITPPLSMVEKL